MTRKLKVIVVGGGMGGLTAAAALSQRGHEVELYEQSKEFGEVGAGIQLAPNATKVFRALGIEQEMGRFGFKPEAITGWQWKTGRALFRTPLQGTCERLYGAGYFHYHRADVQRVLKSIVPDSIVHLSSRCVGVRNARESAVAQFAGGHEAEGDLVVGADGIHSVIRNELFGNESPRYTGNMTWRALVPVEKPDPDLATPTASFWLGPKGHVVTYYVNGGKAVNIVAVRESDSWVEESWTVPSTREELMQGYVGWNEKLLRLFSQAEKIYKWGLFDRDPMKTWTKGNVTLMGDAAHPMLPFLSQGAAMAIEDGYVLAAALARTDNVKDGLHAYERARLPRTTRVQLGARAKAGDYHLSSPLLQLWREIGFKARGLFSIRESGLNLGWVYEHDVTRDAIFEV
jgi:salicylate hydroxylase